MTEAARTWKSPRQARKHENITGKIAIVVPVYNVEKYVTECLQSVLNQTYQNWECFVIDDGTPDDSGMIIDRFADHDVRFRVFHKKNGGLSSARNAALDVVFHESGRFTYLHFLDSDDRIPENFLAEMVNAICMEHTDMAVCPFIPFHKNGTLNKVEPFQAVLNHDELADAYFGERLKQFGFGRFLGNKFFVLDRIFGMYFKLTFRTAEDQEWFVDVMLNIRSCVTVPTTHFQYRLRASSLSHSNRVLQDYDTFLRVLKTTYKHFSPLAQSLIQNRFIESMYNEIRKDIYCNVAPNRIKKKIADGILAAKKTFRHPITNRQNRRHFTRLKYWPFFLLRWYIERRAKKQMQTPKEIQHLYYD